MKLIEAERRDGLVRFWFNAHEPLGPEYHSLNSTYLWGYTQISPEFPNLPDEVVFLAGMLVVVPSVSPNSGAVAAADFHRPGLHLKMLPQRRIESGGQRYFLNLLRVEPDSQASASQAVILGARDQGEHLRDAFWQNCGALQSFRRFGSVGAVPLRLRIEPHLPRNSLAAALKQKKAWT
ncbi:MAG TPA: hypothetical protein VLY04_23255 [Bryobacteraceae bacterium]|nr:hypothetical protein [Bryobacteraceae bacterium]